MARPYRDAAARRRRHGRWTRAVLESIVITLAAQWVLCLLPWPLLALFGRRRPFCSVFSLRPCVGSNAELGRAAVLAVRLLPPVLVGAALWFALARVPLVWFWPVAMGKRRLHRRGAWHGV